MRDLKALTRMVGSHVFDDDDGDKSPGSGLDYECVSHVVRPQARAH